MIPMGDLSQFRIQTRAGSRSLPRRSLSVRLGRDAHCKFDRNTTTAGVSTTASHSSASASSI